MRNKAVGSVERLQYDTEGHLVGKTITTAFGVPVLLLESDYLLVKIEETGRVRIWDCERRRLVEFARHD